jgi:hypothetical protein
VESLQGQTAAKVNDILGHGLKGMERDVRIRQLYAYGAVAYLCFVLTWLKF